MRKIKATKFQVNPLYLRHLNWNSKCMYKNDYVSII